MKLRPASSYVAKFQADVHPTKHQTIDKYFIFLFKFRNTGNKSLGNQLSIKREIIFDTTLHMKTWIGIAVTWRINAYKSHLCTCTIGSRKNCLHFRNENKNTEVLQNLRRKSIRMKYTQNIMNDDEQIALLNASERIQKMVISVNTQLRWMIHKHIAMSPI